ncbi:hypothetical protein RUND412_001203 [Rhizina undulata]
MEALLAELSFEILSYLPRSSRLSLRLVNRNFAALTAKGIFRAIPLRASTKSISSIIALSQHPILSTYVEEKSGPLLYRLANPLLELPNLQNISFNQFIGYDNVKDQERGPRKRLGEMPENYFERIIDIKNSFQIKIDFTTIRTLVTRNASRDPFQLFVAICERALRWGRADYKIKIWCETDVDFHTLKKYTLFNEILPKNDTFHLGGFEPCETQYSTEMIEVAAFAGFYNALELTSFFLDLRSPFNKRDPRYPFVALNLEPDFFWPKLSKISLTMLDLFASDYVELISRHHGTLEVGLAYINLRQGTWLQVMEALHMLPRLKTFNLGGRLLDSPRGTKVRKFEWEAFGVVNSGSFKNMVEYVLDYGVPHPLDTDCPALGMWWNINSTHWVG